jgi:hypothetical protein
MDKNTEPLNAAELELWDVAYTKGRLDMCLEFEKALAALKYIPFELANEREKKLIQAAADLGTYFCFEEEKRVADESQVYKRAGLKELE